MQYQVQADSLEINDKNVVSWLNTFKTSILTKRQELGNYYDGDNEINKQGAIDDRPNYQVNVNMAKYITDVATGYTFGKPVTYSTNNDKINKTLEKILYINKNSKTADVDFEIGGDMSAYGVGYQLIMLKPKKNLLDLKSLEDRIIVKRLEPEQTFFVVDNTILKEPVCAIYFYNYTTKNQARTKVYVYTDKELKIYDGSDNVLALESSTYHNMGSIPILQTLNNDDAFGDYQQVRGLLDALSLAVSNNTDNLQSIANAILAIYGAILNEEQIKQVNKYKVMHLQGNGASQVKAEWLIKDINPEAEKMQIDNLLKFIFQISQVPDLTDDAFGGNQSGVAMQFKLWGIDQLWSTKVREYTQTIYDRLKIFLHLIQYRVTNNVQLIDDIELSFAKNLPSSKSDEYEMVRALKGVVSNKLLLSKISIVDDVEAELEEIKTERQEEMDSYGFNNNGAMNEQ